MHQVTEYAQRVVYGDLREQCGIWEIHACKRHLDDLERSKEPDFPYVFDETRADRIVRHFGNLVRRDKPSEYIKLKDWQIFDDGCIFGWVEKGTGKRRFKKAYRRIARGHAKTTNAGGVGLYVLTGDAMYPPYQPKLAEYEIDPCVLICAVDKVQGRIAREDIAKMGASSPAMSKRLNIRKSYIENKKRGGSVEILSKDTKNKDGARPNILITEEWHAHKDNAVHNVAESGLGKTWQSLEYIITTAGTDAENKPCYKDDQFYKRILSGETRNDDIFIMIREIDDDDDPHDKNCWGKANPFFRDLSDEYALTLKKQVCSEHDAAYNSGDADKIREFLIKRMNRWQVDDINKYFDQNCMNKLKACAISREEFAELTKGTKGHYGFDLGKTIDLSGSAYVTYLKDGRLAFAVRGFMPQERATQHMHSDRVEYMEWAKDGWVTLTPGEVTDSRYVERWIYESEKNNGWGCKEVDYDGHNAVDMAIRIQEHYRKEEKVVEIPQTCAGQNQATKRFRELVLEGKVVTEDNPLAYWCLRNAIEVTNNYGDIKLNKKHKDDSQRIDPIAALMNALARMIVAIDKSININESIKRRGYAIK